MDFKNLYNTFARHPEGSWIMVPENALALFRLVKTRPIKRILDLGTGIGLSAAVCALAFKEKGEKDGHIDTIEQFDKCVRLANELIPADLKSYITIHKANPAVWQTDKIPHQHFSVFDALPEGPYDLIVNDGPAMFLENGHLIDLPNGTIHKLLLEEKLKPGVSVVFDGRVVALRSLERYFGDNFFLTIPDHPRSDFFMLERKNIPLKFEDDTLTKLTDLGYFRDGGAK